MMFPSCHSAPAARRKKIQAKHDKELKKLEAMEKKEGKSKLDE